MGKRPRAPPKAAPSVCVFPTHLLHSDADGDGWADMFVVVSGVVALAVTGTPTLLPGFDTCVWGTGWGTASASLSRADVRVCLHVGDRPSRA